ncbi:MAG: hypothetical protein WC732_05870 [Candidatus Omnitrophota bacterium]
MKKNRFGKRDHRAGLGVVEYVVLIVAIIAAMLTIQTPLRRALCARWRDAADSFGVGRQYENEGPNTTTVVRE